MIEYEVTWLVKLEFKLYGQLGLESLSNERYDQITLKYRCKKDIKKETLKAEFMIMMARGLRVKLMWLTNDVKALRVKYTYKSKANE